MSIHPSLNISEQDKKQRSVLKRTERIRSMLEKGDWKEGDKVYGLPKLKTIRYKLKKEKVEKPAEAEGAVAAEGAPAEATEAKKEEASSPAKGAAEKTKEKK